MIKKALFLFLIGIVLLTGCSKNDENKTLKKIKNNIERHEKYEVKANLELISNDESYNYNVIVNNYKDKYYKVSLVNKANSKEQVILKNEDAVYVITPSLNKSFKFQSNWPNNSSQIYLLESIYNDIKTDDKRTFTKTSEGYTFTSSVNFPANSSLKKQKVLIDKDYNINQVEVLNKNNVAMMTIVFQKPKGKNLSEEDFNLDTFIEAKENNKDEKDKKDESVGDLNDIVYPLYLPKNTKLTHKQTVNTENGERAILTFAGDKSFILVEESAMKEDEFTVIPTSGEPHILMDAIGTLSDNSVSWTSNNIDYYITSTVMNQSEMLEVAQSINVVPNTK